jgi:hypothetical protein
LETTGVLHLHQEPYDFDWVSLQGLPFSETESASLTPHSSLSFFILTRFLWSCMQQKIKKDQFTCANSRMSTKARKHNQEKKKEMRAVKVKQI